MATFTLSRRVGRRPAKLPEKVRRRTISSGSMHLQPLHGLLRSLPFVSVHAALLA
jgi:hypothetical protein